MTTFRSIDAGSEPPASGRNRDRASPRLALAGLSLSMLLSSLGTSSANVALPAGAGLRRAVPGRAVGGAGLLAGGDRAGGQHGPAGRLADAGACCWPACSLRRGLGAGRRRASAGVAGGGARARGLGAAILMALTLALVGEAVPQERAGSAMGLLGTMSAVGTALGPSLGGLLIAGGGWRACSWPTCRWGCWRGGWHGAACRPIPTAGKAAPASSIRSARCCWRWRWPPMRSP